jgi:hypothetical protein
MPEEIQMACADRLLYNLNTQNVVMDRDIRFTMFNAECTTLNVSRIGNNNVTLLAQITPVAPLLDWRMLEIGDE